MEKTTNPAKGWWWTYITYEENWEVVHVDSTTFWRVGWKNRYAVDGVREFWGPIPNFVPPTEPAEAPRVEPASETPVAVPGPGSVAFMATGGGRFDPPSGLSEAEQESIGRGIHGPLG